jgi:hypothetical protein
MNLIQAGMVAVWNPDDVTENYHSPKHSCRTITNSSTQPVTEMNTRNIYCGVKAAGDYG